MDSFLCPIFTIYYRFCNPLTKREYEEKKKDDDFKQKNHQEILDIVSSHPLEILKSLNTKEIDQLAKRLADLLKNSLFTYPMTDDFIQESDLVQEKIADSDYKLSKRFRSSFKYYIQDLAYIDYQDQQQYKAYRNLALLPMWFDF